MSHRLSILTSTQSAEELPNRGNLHLPADTARLRAVRLWRERWKIEQGYQQMKELGLDHFVGRSWRGCHHHAALVMLAFGFLALEQRRAKPRPPSKRSLPPRLA